MDFHEWIKTIYLTFIQRVSFVYYHFLCWGNNFLWWWVPFSKRIFRGIEFWQNPGFCYSPKDVKINFELKFNARHFGMCLFSRFSFFCQNVSRLIRARELHGGFSVEFRSRGPACSEVKDRAQKIYQAAGCELEKSKLNVAKKCNFAVKVAMALRWYRWHIMNGKRMRGNDIYCHIMVFARCKG